MSTQIIKNIPYYFIILSIFVLFKLAFRELTNNDLIFLLLPVTKFVEILTNTNFIYLDNDGFYDVNINIIIDKSCSGFNFWILSFLAFSYLLTKYLNKNLEKTISIPIALFIAYLLTIFANASRISVCLVFQDEIRMYLSNQQHLLHEFIGIITNLSFLVLSYYFFEKFLIQIHSNAKLT